MAFSLIELIFTVVLVSIIASQFIPKNNLSKLNLAADKIILYLKYTRYVAMIDNKFDASDTKWYKARWTLKFLNCRKSVGGLYFVIGSEKSPYGGQLSEDECAKDPITNKWLYSSNYCKLDEDRSKYILLTQEYGVTRVDIYCNKYSKHNKISFGADGNTYCKTNTISEDILTKTCYIKLYDIQENNITIAIEPVTGFIHKL
jgi:hypothetical protein